MTPTPLLVTEAVLLLALLWPKGGTIAADWLTGVALTLMYAAVMLGVMALWARRWRLRPLPAALIEASAESDPNWMRGPYRFVRHPMQLAVLGGALGTCLLYRLPANLALAAAIATVATLAMRASDRRLAAAGPRCAAWVARLPALLFVPGWRRGGR